jgi:nitrogen-specific signal transduction histidine kinase
VTGWTTRADADADFEHRAILAEDRLRAMSMLIAGVTHEINNPLTAIQGLVSLLRAELPDNEERQDLDIVLTETERTVRIVRNLRAFAGRVGEPRQSQLNDAVRQVTDARGYEIRARGIELELDLAPDMSYVAATVPELLSLTLQMVLWAEQALLAVPQLREDGTHDIGARRALRMTLRTRLDEPECAARLTVTHDGLPLDADIIASPDTPGGAAIDAGNLAATVAGDSAVLALVHAAADLGGTLAGGNLPGQGASLTVSIPTVPAEDSVVGVG